MRSIIFSLLLIFSVSFPLAAYEGSHYKSKDTSVEVKDQAKVRRANQKLAIFRCVYEGESLEPKAGSCDLDKVAEVARKFQKYTLHISVAGPEEELNENRADQLKEKLEAKLSGMSLKTDTQEKEKAQASFSVSMGE